MKIYKFYYRIEKKAGLKSKNGDIQSGPAYSELCFEAKKKLNNKERDEVVQKFRKELAEQLGVKVWHVIPISEKEYTKSLEEE
ncbi:hypothetical protein HNQ80_002218 [Anaerosolibacter carboniphilus]|uniref:Uncharacterized protein n=1 Tax=Anaerosolibacter carboniphilus TaxID=1417629 RepID=A0A841L156_9FIRM|nr:hypothetical protein [Anaerosolibacter carboniphilus]MBB6216119.1 hypothetical protein [Anaerosolibacter carboniphilus]